MVLYIRGHVYKNIHWIIFVTTSNSAFMSRKQIYIHEINIQKYHYFNQCIWRFAYHTSNHNCHEYKFVYYINANANNNNNKVTGITQLNAFSCVKKLKKCAKCTTQSELRYRGNEVLYIHLSGTHICSVWWRVIEYSDSIALRT